MIQADMNKIKTNPTTLKHEHGLEGMYDAYQDHRDI